QRLDGFLPRDALHVAHRVVEHLAIGHGLAYAHIQRNLRDARHFHGILQTKLLLDLVMQLCAILIVQSGHSQTLIQMSTTSLLDLKIRTFPPSSATRNPTRSPFFVLGLNNATLETAIGISLSTMPPCTGGMAFGLAFWCFLAMLMPSTSTRSSSNTRSTVPRRPLSFPLMTTTSSPFLILFISNFLG